MQTAFEIPSTIPPKRHFRCHEMAIKFFTGSILEKRKKTVNSSEV